MVVKQRRAMLSKEASGNNDENLIIELAQLITANPWMKLDLIGAVSQGYGRSVVEREVIRLAKSIGPDRKFSLAEVLVLLIANTLQSREESRLLVAPARLLDSIPPGHQVKSIPSYLEGILRKAERQVLLLAPFWDMSTLIDLLRCIPKEGAEPELVLLLVHMNRPLRVESIANEILSIWPPSRVRIFMHVVDRRNSTEYPHAKCLLVDKTLGYLGSANFTGHGMKGHFEVGIALGPKESNTLADILQSLQSKIDLFALAWDSAECVGRDG